MSTATDRIRYMYDPQWRRRGFAFDGQSGHRGLDIAMDPHEPVYALREGYAVIVTTDDELGGYVSIQYDTGAFDGYCHIIPGIEQGYYVSAGDQIGVTATFGDDAYHGSAWTGPHLHKTEGSSAYPWLGVRDPRPGIDAVLAQLATPLAPPPVVPEPVPVPVPVPEPEPAPVPVPEPEPAPVPTPEPPAHRPGYPVPVVETTHLLAAAEVASTLLPVRARAVLYVVYGLAGVALGAAASWLTSTAQLAPEWLVGASAVYGYLGAFIAVLARANVPPKPEGDA